MYTTEQKKIQLEILEKFEKYHYSNIENVKDNMKKFKEKHNLNEPMFEVGKCYKSDDNDVICFTGHVDKHFIGGYGVTNDGYFYNNNNWTKEYYTTETPREEFNKMLLDYAKEKYPKGTKVRCLSNSKEKIVDSLDYGKMWKDDIFSYDRGMASILIFEDGKFAEIIEEQPTIIIKVPKGSNYRVDEV